MVYHSATIVFAPARRGARAGERLGFSCSLGCVPVVRDFSTAASPSLEMTRLSTVSLRPCSLPRDCHVASLLAITGAMYRSARLTAGRGRPALPKRETTFQTSTCSRRYTCGRTRNAPTYSPESKYGHRRLARRDFPAIVDLPTAHRHCRLAILAHQRTRNAISF